MGKLTSTYGTTDELVTEVDVTKAVKSGLDQYEDDEGDRLLDTESDPLSSGEKFAFAAGALVNALSTCTTGFYLNPFLLEVAQIQATLVSLMMFIGRGWDAVTTAMVGALVSKYPNLRRWLLIGSIPTSAAYMAIWIIIPGLSANQRAGWHFVMYLLFQLGTSAYHVPYTALTVRMHHDGKQRDAATTWRMLAEILSVLFGAGVQGFILSMFNANDDTCNSCSDSDTIDKDAENGYFYSAVVMTSVIVIGGIICPLGVKERVQVKELGEDEEKPSVLSSIKLALSNRSFVTLTGAFFFIWLTVQAVQGNILLYAKYSIPAWKDDFQYLLGALVFCATIGMPVWMVVMKKIGKKRSYIIGGTLLAPMLHILYWLPDDASVWAGLAICISAGFALAACYLLPWAMLPSVVDDAELKTGRREEAIFYAFFVFFMKMGAGIALAGSAMALNIAGWEDPCCRPNPGYDICDCNDLPSCDCGQPDGVGDALRLVIGIIGPILIMLGVVLLFFFPITPEREEEIRAEKAAIIRNASDLKRGSRMSLADQGLTQNFIPTRSTDFGAPSGLKRRTLPSMTHVTTTGNHNPLTNKRPHSLDLPSAKTLP